MTDCMFPKGLEKPEMLCELPCPVTEAREGGLKLLLGLMVKYSCLEAPVC